MVGDPQLRAELDALADHVTFNFTWSEFSSPRVVNAMTGLVDRLDRIDVPSRFRPSVYRVCLALEVLRSELDDSPVDIVSGWRTKEFNRRSKGRATKSKHLLGQAADIRVRGHGPARVYWTLDALMRSGRIPLGGLAAYPTFVHYDIRGYRAFWRRAPRRPA